MSASHLTTRRLTIGDEALADRLFVLLAKVFETEKAPLDEAYLSSLLARQDFWALAAFNNNELVGGLTAHTLPMTTGPYAEVFVYDVAVREDQQRRGIGRLLMTALREAARAQGITDIFVAADNEDSHALDFYRALGGVAGQATFFSFGDDDA